MLQRHFTLLIFLLLSIFISCKNSPVQQSDTQETIVINKRITQSTGGVYDLRYPLSKPLISGHRGAKAYANYPENCLETFQYLRKNLDCIIECDVAKTKDGILVLMHDKSIDRTTNGNGPISDLTYEEVKDLQLKDHTGKLTSYKIPKFLDILKWAKSSNTILSVDKKSSVDMSQVIKMIRENNAEANSMMISYSAKMSQEIYDLAPDLVQSVSLRNMEELKRWEKNKIPPADKAIAFTGTRRSPAELYEAIHQYGIPCIFGTLGNIDRQAQARGDQIYQEFLEIGVDIIATDRPLEVGKVIE